MQKKLGIVLFISLLLLPIIVSKSYEIQANDINIDLDEFGNLIPQNNTYLMMPYAEVLFIITNTSEVTDYHVYFNANYTIFNPNVTVSTLIGAPFMFLPSEILTDIKITANGSEIEAELIHVEGDQNDPWNEYFGSDYSREFLVSNCTFPALTSTIIHYSFDYFLSQADESHYSLGGVMISYDVGTARAWNGNITETVEFAVYGQQPDWYSSGLLKEPTIAEMEGGYRYIWFWENEIIEYNTINVGFPYYTSRITGFNLMVVFLTTVIFSIIKISKMRISKSSRKSIGKI